VNDATQEVELCRPPALRHYWATGFKYAEENTFVHGRIICRVCSASYITYPGSFSAEVEHEEWRRIAAGFSPRYPVWDKLRF
jgi:hypothetical protein